MEGDDRITLKEFFGEILEQGADKLKEGDYYLLGKILTDNYNKVSPHIIELDDPIELAFYCDEITYNYPITHLIYESCDDSDCDMLHLRKIRMGGYEIHFCRFDGFSTGLEMIMPTPTRAFKVAQSFFHSKNFKSHRLLMSNTKRYRNEQLLSDVRMDMIKQLDNRIRFEISQKHKFHIPNPSL